ncbi:universal stress protein [Georgenia thermotolerans]|uniref:Universal stress protein n=1 Tax=Georgenia thermotolerans TaxID=527326 RepID=A0A7J5ULP8_9MICO|nr:universal stress protein [Georgenia thermotolerans]KAE8763295.1 universal stress protein [Georgenia thermotolerans]
MDVVVWLTEATWPGCVAGVRRLVPDDARLTLLYVESEDLLGVAGGAAAGLLGRGRRPPGRGVPGALDDLARRSGDQLLAEAAALLGREARRDLRRGRVERVVVDAVAGADLLVLARDDGARLGPRSLEPPTRFVVDHAPCDVLLVAPDGPAAQP